MTNAFANWSVQSSQNMKESTLSVLLRSKVLSDVDMSNGIVAMMKMYLLWMALNISRNLGYACFFIKPLLTKENMKQRRTRKSNSLRCSKLR